MLYQFIFFLAVLWTLMTRKLDILLYLIVFALGLYILIDDYRMALLISVIMIGTMIGGYENEGFKNPDGSEGSSSLKPKPILEIKDDKPEPAKNKDVDLLEKQLGKEAHIDAGTNFLKAYESLNPEQIESMRKDTTELIETQKVLMKTLTGMAPILENSQKMMTMFKGSFGEDFMKQAVASVGMNGGGNAKSK
jgi:hypothetical protein